MANIPKTIREAHVSTSGDPDAGIGGESALIVADGDHLVDLEKYSVEDRQTILEEFRDGLSDVFTALWGECPKVVFDYELGE